mgnify:CR=1 FL=1
MSRGIADDADESEVEESEEKAVTADMIIEWKRIFEPLSDSRWSARTDRHPVCWCERCAEASRLQRERLQSLMLGWLGACSLPRHLELNQRLREYMGLVTELA